MKSRAKEFTIVLMAVLVGLTACATIKKPQDQPSASAPLRGMVYNKNRMPVPDMTVNWGDADPGMSTLTDIHGRFSFPDIAYGQLTLHFAKIGYEPLTWSFNFKEPTQVVYVQISNLDELLDDAADYLQKREWASASSFLERVEKIDPENEIAAFLKAEMLALQGKAEAAAALLETLSSKPDASFAVELALADLYQDKLEQPDKALLHLRKALMIQDDIDIENRISALEKK